MRGAIGGNVPFLCCSVYPCHVLIAPDNCYVLRSHGIRGFRGINVVPRAARFRPSAPDFPCVDVDRAAQKGLVVIHYTGGSFPYFRHSSRTSDPPSSQLVFPHHRHQARNEADVLISPLGMTVDKHMDRRTMGTGPVFPLFFSFFLFLARFPLRFSGKIVRLQVSLTS
ncbi:hypothetical protein EDD16DRAFT_175144 [Pisolithus croceorrhizus]|nr:hypothetical protein EDD16DRAFT_175144 [Pisolithus croceorrhizus]